MEGGPRRLGARRDGGRRGAASARGGDGWGAALQKMERLRTQDALHSWQTFVLLGWEESSLGTYQCHLRRLAAVERRFPCDAKERVLEQAILECARLGKSESTIKGIISAAVMATEVRLVDACIPATIWRSVKAAKKTRNAAKERIWGSPIMLLHMAARASSLEDWAVVGLAIVSFQLFLRVGEAITLQPWAVVDDAVRFFDSRAWSSRAQTPHAPFCASTAVVSQTARAVRAVGTSCGCATCLQLPLGEVAARNLPLARAAFRSDARTTARWSHVPSGPTWRPAVLWPLPSTWLELGLCAKRASGHPQMGTRRGGVACPSPAAVSSTVAFLPPPALGSGAGATAATPL